MKKISSKKGFSLVELVVIIAVSAIVLTPFSLLMTSSLQNEAKINRVIDAQHKTQSSFIVLNELCRSAGFKNIEMVTHAHYNNLAIRVGTKVVFLKDTEFVMQTYNSSSEDTSGQVILSNYVDSVTMTLTGDQLEISLAIDVDNDSNVEDTFVFKYSKRY